MSYLPSYAQLVAAQFSPDGSAGVLDFVRHDKKALTYVRLASESAPGCFALLREGKTVFRGSVSNEARFWAMLWQHGWHPACLPASWEFDRWYKKTYETSKTQRNGRK